MAITTEKLELDYRELVAALATYEESIDKFISENEAELESFRPVILRGTTGALRAIATVREAVEIMTDKDNA